MKLRFIIAVALLMLGLVSGEISSPAPSPDLAANTADSPPIPAPTPDIVHSPSPAESPIVYSSPPKPETEHSPSPSPSDSPSDDGSTPSPTPSLPEASDIKGIEEQEKKSTSSSSSGSGGMSGGTKAGVAFGTIAAVCVVGLAGFVYKKRQDNIRRSRYGYAARDIL